MGNQDEDAWQAVPLSSIIKRLPLVTKRFPLRDSARIVPFLLGSASPLQLLASPTKFLAFRIAAEHLPTAGL